MITFFRDEWRGHSLLSVVRHPCSFFLSHSLTVRSDRLKSYYESRFRILPASSMTGPPIAPTFFLQREEKRPDQRESFLAPGKTEGGRLHYLQKTFCGKFPLTLCCLMPQGK